jgi:rare lipoprotein A
MNRQVDQHGAFTTCLVVTSLIFLGGCSLLPNGHADYDAGLKERGTASWYGEQFHGRLTASGKVYDQHKLTAAHRMLPLGSRVRVMNALNGRQVEVLINDRGPYIDGRIIDLSHGAAEQLDMIETGTSPVTIEVIAEDVPESRVNVFASASFLDQGALPGTRAWAAAAVSAAWGSRYGDVWIARASDEQTRIVWPPLRDLNLNNERRSRRVSQPFENLPLPLELSTYPLLDESSLSLEPNSSISV